MKHEKLQEFIGNEMKLYGGFVAHTFQVQLTVVCLNIMFVFIVLKIWWGQG